MGGEKIPNLYKNKAKKITLITHATVEVLVKITLDNNSETYFYNNLTYVYNVKFVTHHNSYSVILGIYGVEQRIGFTIL